jgi:hypothetical protein
MPAHVRDLRERSRETFHAQLRDAFAALDTGSPEPDIRTTIHEALVVRLQKEAAAKARRARVLSMIASLSRHPQLRLPVRALSKLFPRY